MSRRVLTLDAAGVAGACRRIESLCAGLRPDLVVGIAEGGVEVAGRVFPSVEHCVIGSRHRHRVKGFWLSRLPVWLLDRLRVLEVRLRRRRSSRGLPSISSEMAEKVGKARCILVIDDAVDSGATLQAAVSVIRAIAPEAEVATAVLTVTRGNLIARPDFCCYPEGTILRFPWSLDAKR